MIIKKMLGIHWIGNKDGGAYYEDESGNDWYEFRNSLAHDKPIIVVNSDTRLVLTYHIGDPSFVGLINETIDVYQIDKFPVKDFNDFLSKKFTFSKEGFLAFTDLTPPTRTKEDIAADLVRLQEELSKM